MIAVQSCRRQRFDRSPDEFAALITEHALDRGIEHHDDSVLVDNDYAAGAPLDDRPEHFICTNIVLTAGRRALERRCQRADIGGGRNRGSGRVRGGAMERKTLDCFGETREGPHYSAHQKCSHRQAERRDRQRRRRTEQARGGGKGDWQRHSGG